MEYSFLECDFHVSCHCRIRGFVKHSGAPAMMVMQLSHVVSICRGKYLYGLGKKPETGANQAIEFDALMQP
jgi:hypothetical protein